MEIACDAAFQNRRYDADGRLHILRTPISKATVNPYYGREIPESDKLGLEPERVYYMLRDPGELAKSAPSFARNQLMFKHTAVSADDPKQEAIAGTIGSEVEFLAPYLIADICIWDAEAIAGVETDTVRELSASYRYRADMTPGMYEGQRYDGVMRDIQGNHVALVKSGRAGSDVMAADSKLETKMETKFGKALYAILCAASPKLAQDAALKPLVIGMKRRDFDLKALEPKLLAMDAELRKPETLAAMQAAKDAAEEDRPVKAKDRIAKDAQTSEERAMWAQMRKDGSADDPEDDAMPASLRKAKDSKIKRAKDKSFDEWAKDEEEMSEDKRKAHDAEEDDEDKAKRKEYEKKAEDAMKTACDDFDGLVSKLEDKGYSKEYAAKVAGKVAAEKGKTGGDSKKAKDAEEDEKKKAEDKMKHAMDEFRAELREADEARRAVRPIVGDVLAQDSAEGIYGFALDQMKIDRKDVQGVPALRALFNLAQQANKPAPRQAFDSAGVEEKFVGAGRSIQVM